MSSLSISLNITQRIIIQYCHSTIFIFGIIGSLINILLFSRPYLRSNSCCIYFLASSASALVLLSIGILPQLYSLYNSPNPFTTISSFCKVRSYLNQTSAMSCRWLLVLACIDRCLSSSNNIRLRRFSSIIIARRIIIITISICLILPIHTLIFSDIQPPGNIACSIKNNHVAIYHRFYTIIIGAILPIIISLICCLLIRQYIRGRKYRLIIISNRTFRRKKRNRDQQVLFMLLIQVVIFIVSTIPFMSLNIYITMTQTITNKSTDRKAIERFLKTFTELFIYFITLSFYSNTLVSYTFRKQFIILFKLIINCGHQQYRRTINTMQMTTTMRTIEIVSTKQKNIL